MKFIAFTALVYGIINNAVKQFRNITKIYEQKNTSKEITD